HVLLVHVVSAELRVAVGGLHFHHAAAHFQHGNIECAAAQVIHCDSFVVLFVQPVRECGRRRLVDDTHHFQAGDFPCLLGGLPLCVVEVRRHGNHCFADFLPEEVLRRRL